MGLKGELPIERMLIRSSHFHLVYPLISNHYLHLINMCENTYICTIYKKQLIHRCLTVMKLTVLTLVFLTYYLPKIYTEIHKIYNNLISLKYLQYVQLEFTKFDILSYPFDDYATDPYACTAYFVKIMRGSTHVGKNICGKTEDIPAKYRIRRFVFNQFVLFFFALCNTSLYVVA